MRSHPISRYLVRFDADDVPAPTTSLQIIPDQGIDPAEIEAAAREMGFVEGRHAGLAQARDEADLSRRMARAAFDDELMAERAKWVEEEAERLTAAITEGFDVLTADLAHCVDQILRPFLQAAARAKALAALAESFARLGDAAPLMKISGPADLLEAMRDKNTWPAERVELTTDSNVDISIVAQPTLIETRLGAWATRLDKLEEQTARV